MVLRVLFAGVCFLAACSGAPGPPEQLLTPEEQRDLVLLAPAVVALASEGVEVVVQMYAEESMCSYYRVDALPPNPVGSDLVGHFGVDRRTAEVFSADIFEECVSEELSAAQKRVRGTHGVTAQQVDWFRGECYGEGPSSNGRDG